MSSNFIITNDIILTMASNPVSGTNTPEPVRFDRQVQLKVGVY